MFVSKFKRKKYSRKYSRLMKKLVFTASRKQYWKTNKLEKHYIIYIDPYIFYKIILILLYYYNFYTIFCRNIYVRK